MAELYRAADIFVSSYRGEGFSLPTLEAMACGIGICMTCVLPVKDQNGKISNLRSCIDGPVMDGASIEWDLVGKTVVL